MRKVYVVGFCIALALAFTAPGWAAEYYIVGTRSGDLEVTQGKPEGKGTMVEGPFASREEARRQLEDIKKAERRQTEGSGSQEAKQGSKEYYVVETPSGQMRVVDHKPEGRAEKVDGPFDSKQQAREAMQQAKADRSQGREAQQEKARKTGDEKYYVIRTQAGELRVVDHKPEGRAEKVDGPFASKEQARQAMKQARAEDRKKGEKRAEAEQEEQYYVAKGKRDQMKVIDHKPKGQAEAVKGPFESEAKARQALKEAKDEEKQKQKASEKEQAQQEKQKQADKEDKEKAEQAGREQTREQTYGACLPPEKAKRMGAYYVVKDEFGRMDVRSFAGDQPILFGPFRTHGQAESAMLTGRCAR